MTFQQVLSARGISFRRSASDANKTHLNCPFCVSRGKPRDERHRLCVHSAKGWGRCVHCGWSHGRAILIVLKNLGIEAEVRGIEAKEARPEIVRLPADFTPLSSPVDALDRQALRYLYSRGVTPEQVRRRKIGASYSGKYAYRILFPVYVEKQLRAINARDFTGRRKPKYLNSRGDKYLFAFDPSAKVSVLSEGAIKALRLETATGRSSASLLGHDLTPHMLEQLTRSACEEVILYPDLDVVGRRGTAVIAEKLQREWSGRVRVAWPVQKPADEENLLVLTRLISQAKTYSPSLRMSLISGIQVR